MKKTGVILKYELGNYFGSKSYIISTVLICLLCIGIMFAPRIIDSFKGSDNDTEESADKNDAEDEFYLLYDPEGLVDTAVASEYLEKTEIRKVDSLDALKEQVGNEESNAIAGFAINSVSDFDYYVYNKSMYDTNSQLFAEYMSMLVKLDYCTAHNLDIEEFLGMENAEIGIHENILGKDSTSNYWYCYILVIIVFMIIIMYGVQIATGVANEKSNRSIEIMVTTTSSVDLLFGKVFAGTIAALFQIGLVAVSLLGTYQINKEYWGEAGSMFLDIPSEVLIAFAVFGLGGFLIYAFLYGALGALVSKIEDLNKSAGTAQMLVMIVYIVVLLQLTNIDGVVMKVCSFLPISSYSAMFARVAMGSVEMWEIVVSAILLYASVVGMGIVGGKIFRNSTLRYGNPIKLSNALKDLKKK
ncbi:MAG: ABC transporter permease [Coprococcus sp.]|nr:ABC transporter permease [Coprococcus sp.]